MSIKMILGSASVDQMLASEFYRRLGDYILDKFYDWANHPEYISFSIKSFEQQGKVWFAVVDTHYRWPDKFGIKIDLSEVFDEDLNVLVPHLMPYLLPAQPSG